LLGRRLVEMVGLRIEFSRKALDVFACHGFSGLLKRMPTARSSNQTVIDVPPTASSTIAWR
jgi:hypothetical protein